QESKPLRRRRSDQTNAINPSVLEQGLSLMSFCLYSMCAQLLTSPLTITTNLAKNMSRSWISQTPQEKLRSCVDHQKTKQRLSSRQVRRALTVDPRERAKYCPIDGAGAAFA
ncbi:hypothetical protein Vretifemale_5478, partial [Volvox reticuliferus]